MSRRKRYVKPVSKYEAEKVHISSEVIKIEQQNEPVNDKYKTVFYCKSKKIPEGRMCIAWGRTRIAVGSKVEMDGRLKEDVFLVWSLTITNNVIAPVEHNPHIEKIREQVMRLKNR